MKLLDSFDLDKTIIILESKNYSNIINNHAQDHSKNTNAAGVKTKDESSKPFEEPNDKVTSEDG